MFKKQAVEAPMPVNIKSRFQSIRDDAITARDAFERIANTANTMIADATKGMRFAEKWITDADQIIEELGGEMEENIKQAIDKKYLPPQYREENHESQ